MTPSEAPDPLEELVGIHEHLRHAMICFFQRRRVPDAEELAAEVFLRPPLLGIAVVNWCLIG